MLNLNYLVIKLSLELCLLSIHVEYMYMCVHMFIMDIHIPMVCVYIF